MLLAERHEKIVEIVQSRGSVQVDELAKELKVSTMTIRRDLEKLQESGRISRCHGGAVANREDESYEIKQISHKEEKEKIAERAVTFIPEGASIYLDAGTTTFEIAKLLADREDLLIVTNDLEIAHMVNHGKAELIVCGGCVQKTTGSMWGSYATQMMKNMVFDIGFFGAAKVNEKQQVLTPTAKKAFLKRMVWENCKDSYLVVDASKFYGQAINIINELSDYTAVITDYTFSPEEKKELKKKQVVIEQVL